MTDAKAIVEQERAGSDALLHPHGPTLPATSRQIAASAKIQAYFDRIEAEVTRTYHIAQTARAKGLDPEERVDIPIARNMAERVEGLISIAAPQLVGSGMTSRILELEKTYAPGAWEVGLLIAEEVAKERFCTFKDKREAMEVGIRCGMAYVTSGIVAAPLEGFIELKLKKRRDAGEYFSICYAGPIRGAGGTAASVSVIIADYVRTKMGYAPFDPTENEVKRFVTEVTDYHERVTNLQYFPSEEEVAFMVFHLPVEINGDPTEKFEVSNYKDNPRIEDNRIRGGVCLVLAEGLCQKAPKIWKRLSTWGEEFGLAWGFLSEFLAIQKRIKARSEGEVKKEEKPGILPNYTYITDLVAGRPILSHPMRIGGFRLRYGRCRDSGFSAAAIHPATQVLLDKYIAVGTQLKIERPGKACSIVLCDAIDAPIILLDDGEVVQVKDAAHARQVLPRVQKILFLGDLLFCYGDFEQNGHLLVPAGYCEEWYAQELADAIRKDAADASTEDGLAAHAAGKTGADVGCITNLLGNTARIRQAHVPPAALAIALSKTFGVPLHPRYTYFWTAIQPDELLLFASLLKSAKINHADDGTITKIIAPFDDRIKCALGDIGLPHQLVHHEHIVIKKDHALALLESLGAGTDLASSADRIVSVIAANPGKTALEIINILSGIRLRDRAGTFIGARMGRPEKAKMRELRGSPHCLFPVGDEGGVYRSFQTAVEAGSVTGDFPKYFCQSCGEETIYPVCDTCHNETRRRYVCAECGDMDMQTCPIHGPCKTYRRREIPIKRYFQSALAWLGMRQYPDLIKGVRGTSNEDHVPEHLAKGILRAKHTVFVNKDGTTRYDMSELPITHFRPQEIGTPVETLRELGYDQDIHGAPLTRQDQIIEILPQDIILPTAPDSLDEPADEIVFRIGNFVDDLLVRFYGLEPYHRFRTKADTIGALIIGLAPHISAGTVGRIIGYSKTQGMLCHPMFHAAMRRDCDGDEACLILLTDALLNFSRQYLPNRRGAKTMDAPLVLTTFIKPAEVDDQVHGLDVAWSYPKEFYEAALEYKKPSEFRIEQLGSRLDTAGQYEGVGYTHETDDINAGTNCSAYKTIPSMEDKLKGQMALAERIRAVDESDVARLVIEKHFLKDIKGNLRKFSMQQFRCVKCNMKFRRPPLMGKCTACSGRIIFTITEGSVLKYLDPSISLAEKYHLPPYLRQVLEILRRRAEAVFGKDKEKQAGLGQWFAPQRDGARTIGA